MHNMASAAFIFSSVQHWGVGFCVVEKYGGGEDPGLLLTQLDKTIHHGEKALLPSVRKQLGSLRYISKQISQKSRIVLANGLILGKIQYAITLWGGTYNTNLKKMQAVLNKTARWVTNSSKRTQTQVLMERCNWLSIEDMLNMNSLNMLWKVFWMKIPQQLHDKIRLESDCKVSTGKPRLQTVQKGFLWKTSVLWNQLPEYLRTQKSLPGEDEGRGDPPGEGGGDGGDTDGRQFFSQAGSVVTTVDNQADSTDGNTVQLIEQLLLRKDQDGNALFPQAGNADSRQTDIASLTDAVPQTDSVQDTKSHQNIGTVVETPKLSRSGNQGRIFQSETLQR